MCNPNENKDNNKICYLKDFIELYYVKDENDRFRNEWNLELIKFIMKDHDSRSSVKYGMESLEEEFEIYTKSPLSKYCNFNSFDELLKDSKLEIEENLLNSLGEGYDYGYDLVNNDNNLAKPDDFKECFQKNLIKIINLSINDIQIKYLSHQLFKRWDEFQIFNSDNISGGGQISWIEFVNNYNRIGNIDVFDFLDGNVNIYIMMDKKTL